MTEWASIESSPVIWTHLLFIMLHFSAFVCSCQLPFVFSAVLASVSMDAKASCFFIWTASCFFLWFNKFLTLTNYQPLPFFPSLSISSLLFYVFFPPFPDYLPRVTCLPHWVCFSSFLTPCGFPPCCGDDKLSAAQGKSGEKVWA